MDFLRDQQMNFFRSKSFFFFVLSGLALIALPLVIMVVSSDYFMGRLARHSSTSVYRSVSAAQLGQKLVENITNQERRIRQYLVLGDAQLYEGVAVLHQDILTTLEGLKNLAQDKAQRQRIFQLKNQEDELFSLFTSEIENPEKASLLAENFAELDSLGKDLYLHNNVATYKEVARLQEEAARSRSTLFILACTMLPITILLIGYLARRISSPIKEIDQGIKQLGQGDFSSTITVKGPDDLIFLGRRLNWLRKKLARYEKEKNKFAAHISHELKTPLASIYEGASLLNDEIVGSVNKQQREVVEILRKNCSQLQVLIENLVSYTMAQAQKTALTLSQFCISELILQCIEDYKPAIINNKLQLNTSINQFNIVADRDRIKTVIDNFLSNAIKFSPINGEVFISATHENDSCIFEIADSGQGISDEDKDFIFTPFYQGNATGQTHIKGTGLGLAIAHEYVAAHGGTLELVDSKLPGACFKVTLPIEEQTEVYK